MFIPIGPYRARALTLNRLNHPAGRLLCMAPGNCVILARGQFPLTTLMPEPGKMTANSLDLISIGQSDSGFTTLRQRTVFKVGRADNRHGIIRQSIFSVAFTASPQPDSSFCEASSAVHLAGGARIGIIVLIDQTGTQP